MNNLIFRAKFPKFVSIFLTLSLFMQFSVLLPVPVSAADTGFKSPSENVANNPGGGDPDQWSNPNNAYANGGGYASDDEGERHRYYNFNFDVPSDSSIDGIEVSADAWSTDNSGCKLGVDLSWDGGTSWSNEKTKNLSNSENTGTMGGTNDKWGSHSWVSSDFSDSNFRARVHDIDPGTSCDNSATTKLDWLQVKVHYTEETKVNICHYVGDPDNLWNAIRVNENGWNGHDGHAYDYLYGGDINSQNQQPTNDDWCENNQPGDVCLNIDGLQATLPIGMQVDDNKQCTAIPTCSDGIQNQDETGIDTGGVCTPQPQTATINVQKVVCNSESDLPNWGDNIPEVNITTNTATDYVNQNQNCHLEPWTFEWAPNGTENPGDGTGVAGNPWVPFTGSVEVSPADRIWVREQASGSYIPFSGDTNSGDGWNEVSAEIYCNNDVLNYDNYEWIDNVTAGQNYYCVGFNVLKPQEPTTGTIEITKYACPENTLVNRNDNGVGKAVPQGCTLESGKNFGYVHGDQTDPYAPYPELEASVTAGGSTNSSGVLEITNLLATGRYLIVETDGQNQKLPHGDILGLYCEGDGDTNPNNNDNQELTFVPAGGIAHCVAYNKAIVPDIATCPADTTQATEPLETVVVPSNSSTATQSNNSLANGSKYLMVTSGSWTNSNNLADAEYVTKDNWATFADGYNFDPYFLGEGSFDLQVDNAFVNWGAYNSGHEYSFLYEGTGAPAGFLIFDGDSNPVPPNLHPEWYGDNSGNLEVKIYPCESECQPSSGSIVSDENTVVTSIDVNGSVSEDDFSSLLVSVVPQIQLLNPGVAWAADVGNTNAKWIWSNDPYDPNWQVDKWVTFTREFTVGATGQKVGTLKIAADNSYEVWINDVLVGSDPNEDNHSSTDTWDISSYLVGGSNTLKIKVWNFGRPTFTQEQNPGGLLYNLTWTTSCGEGNDPEEKPNARVILDKTATYDSETGVITFNIDWTITDNSVQNFVITDQIPAGLTFVSADVGGTESGGVVTWNLGSQGIGGGYVSFKASLNAFTSDLLWASGYLDNNQGTRKDGSAVLADRTDPNKALGAAQTSGNPSDTVIPGSFFSLGFDNGSVVLTFDGTIINGDGNDVQVFETTGGTYPEEKVKVEAWNGSGWTDLGTVTRDGAVDLGSLTHTSAIRLTEQSNKALFEATADGYDLDAVKALHALPRVCDVNNTAEFTAVTNVDNVPISGSDSYNLEINQYCEDPQYDGEENGGPIVCATSSDVGCGSPEEENPPAICSNGLDDDGDQLVDLEDPGCTNTEDNDETNAPAGPTLIQTLPITSSGGSSSGGRRHGPLAINSNGGEVLGASTGPMCEEYLKSYIKLGANNDPEEVKKLQEFLNEFMGADLPITGLYGPMTYGWVKKFQSLHSLSILVPWTQAGMQTDDPTGYVYKTTKRWINILKCPDMIISTPLPSLP